MNDNFKVLLIYPPTNNNYGLYEDLKNDDRVFLRCSISKPLKGRLSYFLRNLHFSESVNRIINLPYKEYWYEYYDVINLLSEIQYVLVVDLALNSSMLLNVLEKCRLKKPEIRIGLFYINSWGTAEGNSRPKLSSAIEKAHLFKWDDIYTFDPGDAKKYNMSYMGLNYYSMKEMIPSSQPQYDLYSIGIASRDREDLFTSLYQKLTKAGCNCDFYLKNMTDNNHIIEGVNYIEEGMRPYEKVLQDLQNSKCILEILRNGQKGPSLRYFEAVCYNKKLLTNNAAICDFPYYDERYMKVFSSSEDIDTDWLKEPMPNINYHYKNDFSPIKMIDRLINAHS